MRYLTLKDTELCVSQLCLGAANFGESCDIQTSERRMDQFVCAGGNLLDTAHCYNDWVPGERHRSEKIIGNWLNKRKNRSSIIIGTKGGVKFYPEDGYHQTDLCSESLNQEIDDSLRNLQTDYIDIYWLHRDDPARSVAEIMEALNARVKAGDIRYIGCSNWKPERIAEAQRYAAAHGTAQFIADELEWSVCRRLAPDTAVDPRLPWMTDDAMDYHRSSGMTAFAFTSMASGFYQKYEAFGEAGLSDKLCRAFMYPAVIDGFERLKKLRDATGFTTAQILMGYIRSTSKFSGIPIAFGRTEVQMQELLGAADSVLTEDEAYYLLDGKY